MAIYTPRFLHVLNMTITHGVYLLLLVFVQALTTQVDSLKGALPRQISEHARLRSWKTEGYSTWAFGPSVLSSAFSLQPIYLSSYLILSSPDGDGAQSTAFWPPPPGHR